MAPAMAPAGSARIVEKLELDRVWLLVSVTFLLERHFHVSGLALGDHLGVFLWLCLRRCPKHPRSKIVDFRPNHEL
eukprot:1037567-Prymnesium_polylepis.1